jgi:hypothetical protein
MDMRTKRYAWAIGVAAMALATVGCDDNTPQKPLAPEASTLKPTAKKSAGAMEYGIETSGSKVDFQMDAPKEKIRGRVHDASKGGLQIDVTDLTKTTAHIQVDISGLELYQQRADDDGKFSEENKVEAQNKHARQWLEIGEDAPEDVRKKNSTVEFVLKKVTADKNDVSQKPASGDETKVTLTVTGDFRLHGRKSEKTAKFEATFKYQGDKVVSVHLKTLEPFAIGLAEHEVRPREAFGKLAQKTLEVLAPKVAKDALVSMEFSAKLSGKAAAKKAPEGDTKPAADSSAKPAGSGAY